MVPIAELRPHPKNRNKHGEDQIERLSKLLEAHGQRAPIIVSKRSGFIVKGHGTILSIRKLGQEVAAIVYQDFESEEEEYQFLQADNAIASWAELDLKGIHLDLPDLAPFDIDLLGIRDFQFEPDPEETKGDEDEVPETPNEPKSRLGDLFLLGNHRLLCGDSTDVQTVSKLMNGERADMVFTDPPYNLGGNMDSGIYGGSSLNSHKELSDTKWDDEFDVKPAIRNILSVLAKDSSMYVCTSHFLAGDIWAETKETMDRIGWCVWDKNNPTPSLQKRHWTWCAELICYATRGKHTFNFPVTGHAPNVWRFNKEAHTEGHPTQKPVSIPQHAIDHSSKPGQIVLDLFLGSGSTLIACEKTNRKCYGMEIDPHYCDVILERWAKYSGKDPVREDGVKWSELKAGSLENNQSSTN